MNLSPEVRREVNQRVQALKNGQPIQLPTTQPPQQGEDFQQMKSYAPPAARPPMAIRPLNDVGSVAARAPQNLSIGFRNGVADLAHTGANVARAADNASTWVADKTGLEKGGAFGDIADDLGKAETSVRPSPEETYAAGDSTGDKVMRGVGGAVPQMTGYMATTAATGNPMAGMAAMDAASNLDKGAKATAIAAAKGAALGRFMKYTESLPFVGKVLANAGIGAAGAAAGGGDLSDITSGAIVQGGLSATPQHGVELRDHLARYPEFVNSTIKALGKEAAPHLPQLYEFVNRVGSDPAAMQALSQAALHDPTGQATLAAVLAGGGKLDPKLSNAVLSGNANLSPEQRVSAMVHSDMPWAIVTGTRGAVGDPTHPINRGSNETLRSELGHLGYKPLELEGMYQGQSDGTSFFVPGMSPEQAQSLGKKYGQDSVFVGGGGNPAGILYSETGRLDPSNLSKTVYGNPALQKDYYSVIHDPETGVRTPFSMDVAFGKGAKYMEPKPPAPTDVTAHSEGQDAYYEHVPGKKWPEWTPEERESFGQKFGVPGLGNESPMQPIGADGKTPTETVKLYSWRANPHEVLDPANWGTGKPGAEQQRQRNGGWGDQFPKRLSYWDTPEANERGFGPESSRNIRHTVEVPKDSSLYDLGADPEGFRQRAGDVTQAEIDLRNAGKKGYHYNYGGKNVYAYFDPTTPTKIERFNGSYNNPELIGGKPADTGDGVMIPGGADGTFTHADMMRLKAQPPNPADMTQEQRTALVRKQARSTAPAKDAEGRVDPVSLANGWLFGMQSPNTPLTQNELQHSRLKFRSADDIARLAAMKDWSSDDIARQFNLQSSEKGGLGLRSSVDYRNLAKFADMFQRNPDFFQKQPNESWADHVERVSSQVPGMSAKVGSFGGVWQDPEHADISAVDRHMAMQFMPEMFDTKTERAEWERGVRDRWNALVDRRQQLEKDRRAGAISQEEYEKADEKLPPASTRRVRSFDAMMQADAGQAFAAGQIMGRLGSKKIKYRTANGEINENVPENLRDVQWVEEPEYVQVISGPYRKALEVNARHAAETGLNLFPSQWGLWDTFRRRVEPHEVMYPGYHRVPKMPEDWTRDADEAHRDAGFKASNKEVDETGMRRLKPVRQTDNPGKLTYFAIPAAAAAGAAAKAIDDRKRRGHPSVRM
jgi:hypothetical protein